MNLPILPRSRNSTTPAILANKVSSLPLPTLSPGKYFVPRWRTRMEPPLTVSGYGERGGHPAHSANSPEGREYLESLRSLGYL